MSGFLDFLRMVMGWWSSSGEAPPSEDPVIVNVEAEGEGTVNLEAEAVGATLSLFAEAEATTIELWAENP